MRVLVTGGAGFIGSHLCERLVENGVDVVCLDNFNRYYDLRIKRGNIRHLEKQRRFSLVEGDILKRRFLDSLFKKHPFDVIVHLAARAGVRPSIRHPGLYQRVNVEGTLNVLETGVRYDTPKFVIASSSSVYGNNQKVPFSEDDPVDHPISPYAATKKACELLAYTYHKLHSVSVTCLRFFTVYGPRQRPDMAIHKFTRLIASGREMPVYGDGSTQRDYTYITDIIDGVWSAIDRCRDFRIYNLGESQTVELNRLIGLLEKYMDASAKIKRLPDQPGDVSITFADVRKARKELGYSPHVSIEQGLQEFIRWFRGVRDLVLWE